MQQQPPKLCNQLMKLFMFSLLLLHPTQLLKKLPILQSNPTNSQCSETSYVLTRTTVQLYKLYHPNPLPVFHTWAMSPANRSHS